MSGLSQIKSFIKIELKNRKITYRQLAEQLQVSEVTVKRWLSKSNMSVTTVERIGKLLGFDLFQKVQSDFAARKNFKYYSAAQERFLVKNPIAFLVFIKLAFNYSVDEVKALTGLSHRDFVKTLILLDKTEMIELHSRDRIKFKVRGIFRWQKNGAMMSYYHSLISQTLFNHFQQNIKVRIENADLPDCTLYRPTEFFLSPESAAQMSQEFEQILAKYAVLGQIEKKHQKKIEPISIFLGVSRFDLWRQVLLEAQAGPI